MARTFLGLNTTYSLGKITFYHTEDISTVSWGELMDTFKTMVFELNGF